MIKKKHSKRKKRQIISIIRFLNIKNIVNVIRLYIVRFRSIFFQNMQHDDDYEQKRFS